jgi:flagellar biosynthesis chaperone FliJ
MAKFVFKLNAVIKQRQAVEKLRQAAVAKLEAQRAELEDRLRGCQRTIDATLGQWRDMLFSASPGAPDSANEPSSLQRVDVRGAGMQASASLAAEATARGIVIQLSGVHSHLARARASLALAMRERRAIEMLRDRQYEEWLLDQRRRETAATDEIAARLAFAQQDPSQSSENAA